MYTLSRRRSAVALLAVMLTALVGASARLPAQNAKVPPHDYVQADVDFVQGMIIHHAQAVVMSDWAGTHGARPNLLLLCKRIALSQRDEITMMQHWLQDRRIATPDPLHMLQPSNGPVHDRSSMDMPGMDMGNRPMMMAGMLTALEMRQLDAARGPVFDRLYLTGMIKHHQGALGMVATLFATPGAGQQPELFSFATDVDAGQRAEIARMQAILNTLNPSQIR
ncbi:MAG TPA: DUF305 domain-containing protein [Gemmatimonadaceae bacterium]